MSRMTAELLLKGKAAMAEKKGNFEENTIEEDDDDPPISAEQLEEINERRQSMEEVYQDLSIL